MGMKIKLIRLSDGEIVEAEHEDRGDVVPAYREGNPYRAYTSWIRIGGPGGPEDFLQTDARAADASGNPLEYRRNEDNQKLRQMGYELHPDVFA
jgi:hypothetical protein